MSDNVVDLAQFRARRARQQQPPAAPGWPAVPAQPFLWMPVFFFVPVFFPFGSAEASRAG